MAELLIGSFVEGLKPDTVLTVTQWAEQYRKLDSKGSAEPGPYRVSRTPYMRKVQDSMSSRSLVQKGIFMKGSQVAGTEVGFNIMGYYIDSVPCPVMYVMPTLDTMKRNVKQRIDPMIDNCERLRRKIGKKRSKDGGNTLFQKDYPGGVLIMTGANSAAGLRSIAIRIAIPDEVDAYPSDVEGEGSPISLIEKRQATFGVKKKTYMPSTPTIEGESRIEVEFLLTDQQYYWVPCPHCKKLQVLEFEQIKWEKGKYDGVHYECIHCHKKIFNRDKTWFLRDKEMGGTAEWIASHPELSRPELEGWHLSSLYSPDGWLDWKDVAREWDECENDEPRKKAFINTVLAKTYKVKGDAPPWQQLYERAQSAGLERNKVWSDVAFITAGVDVQADRLEVEIVGWMKGRCSQQIDYRVITGDTTKEDVWTRLGELLNEEWIIESGEMRAERVERRAESGERRAGSGEMRAESGERGAKNGRRMHIKLMAVDTGYNSPKVHDFARIWGIRRVIPIQGRDKLDMPYTSPKAVNKTKLGKNIGKLKVWGVGVSYLKVQLYGWLRLPIPTEGDNAGVIPAGYCHLLPLEGHYFRGLTAEELVPQRNSKSNAIKYEWIKRYVRNEPLDCRIYAMAAAYMLGFDRWDDKRWDKERGAKSGDMRAGSGEREDKSGERGAESGKIRAKSGEREDKSGERRAGSGANEEVAPKKKVRKSRGGFWK